MFLHTNYVLGLHKDFKDESLQDMELTTMPLSYQELERQLTAANKKMDAL